MLNIRVVIVHVNTGIEIKSILEFFCCIRCVTWGLHHIVNRTLRALVQRNFIVLTVCSVLNMSVNSPSKHHFPSFWIFHPFLSPYYPIRSEMLVTFSKWWVTGKGKLLLRRLLPCFDEVRVDCGSDWEIEEASFTILIIWHVHCTVCRGDKELLTTCTYGGVIEL